jgi:integrase
MSVFRYKGSKVWTMDFVFHAQRIRESTGTSSKTLAQKIEAKRRRELEEGTAGIRKHQQPRLLSVASEAWLDLKRATLAPRSVIIEKANLAHLLPELGRKLVCDIDARDVSRYQRMRVDSGASPKTVNLEIGTLRAILKRSGQWARLQPDVKMLATRDDVGWAITSEEEAALLQACGKSRSRSLVPFVTLAIETGARFGVIRTLQWGSVDFENRCLRWGKGQDGFRHRSNHSAKPACNGRPWLLGDSLPEAQGRALCFSHGALRGCWRCVLRKGIRLRPYEAHREY